VPSSSEQRGDARLIGRHQKKLGITVSLLTVTDSDMGKALASLARLGRLDRG
jgi:hypothetical protein